MHVYPISHVHFYPRARACRVDKQRAEYIQAYESHMQDVQKELFLLREKVHILDTDETRAMKMKQLQDEQDRLKAESVHLDEQNDALLALVCRGDASSRAAKTPSSTTPVCVDDERLVDD